MAYVAPQTVLAPTCQKRHAPHLKLCDRWNHTCRLAEIPANLGMVPAEKNRPPHPRGGRSGNFRGSKNQNSGKCHELSRKSIKKFFFTHPTPRGSGGVGGQHFKSPVNFKSPVLSREYITFVFLPIPPRGVPRGGGVLESTFQKSGKFPERSRKSIQKKNHQRGSQWEL